MTICPRRHKKNRATMSTSSYDHRKIKFNSKIITDRSFTAWTYIIHDDDHFGQQQKHFENGSKIRKFKILAPFS
jgi:hypothetical protein